MPSCSACGKWFSEEDRGCGCDGERLSLTRKELRMVAARVLREAEGYVVEPIECSTLLRLADQYERGEREVPA